MARADRTMPWKALALTVLVVSLWINLSEVLRYFVIVLPAIRDHLAELPGAAAMSVPIFLVWALWDTLLVIFVVLLDWLTWERFGPGLTGLLSAATLAWMLFLLFWIAMVNMGLAPAALLPVVLSLAWLEMVVACWLARRCYRRWL
ncbi:MAG: hypothetical protein AAF604_02855 [Acidobacteriota bacterium]